MTPPAEADRSPAQGWLDRFFASYYRHRPVNATFIGRHEFDDRLPDFSAAGVEAALVDAESLLRDAAALDEATLTPVEQLDKRLAEGFLRIQRWEFASRHHQRGNPSLYTGEAIFGVIGLFLTDFAPAGDRIEAAIARMIDIPALLEQAKANIASAPAAWTERALRECTGAHAFFGRGIDLLIQEMGISDRSLRRAADVALTAFGRYEGWLRSTLSQAPSDAVACGGETFDMLLREGHGLSQNGDQVEAYAVEQLGVALGRLSSEAAALGFADWRQALVSLADLHPTLEHYLERYRSLWEASRDLALERHLLTWPDFPIEYVPQPVWAREAAPYLYFLFYRAPAAFNRPPFHRYLVTPIDATLSPEEQERRLRAANDSTIKLNHVVHHGGIGHHVQNWHAYHAASRIGQIAAVDCAARIAMLCGGSMAEGWACYATTLMGEQGFLTPLEQLSEIHTDVRMACRAIVDVRLHQGRMSLDEAAAFYMEQAGMSREAAAGEAAKNSIFPAAAMMYLSGRDEILHLREDLRSSLGERFDLCAFHDRFLSFGSVPVALIAQAMRAESAQPESAFRGDREP